jgi:hypothetical protein
MHKFENRRFQHSAAPIRVEAADRSDAELLLLLALAVGLRRVLVSRLGLIERLGRLLLGAHMVVAAVLLRRSPVSFRGLLVMLGRFLVHFLRHFVSLPIDKVREKFQYVRVERPIPPIVPRRGKRVAASKMTLCSKLLVDEIGGFVRGILGG